MMTMTMTRWRIVDLVVVVVVVAVYFFFCLFFVQLNFFVFDFLVFFGLFLFFDRRLRLNDFFAFAFSSLLAWLLCLWLPCLLIIIQTTFLSNQLLLCLWFFFECLLWPQLILLTRRWRILVVVVVVTLSFFCVLCFWFCDTRMRRDGDWKKFGVV